MKLIMHVRRWERHEAADDLLANVRRDIADRRARHQWRLGRVRGHDCKAEQEGEQKSAHEKQYTAPRRDFSGIDLLRALQRVPRISGNPLLLTASTEPSFGFVKRTEVSGNVSATRSPFSTPST